MSDTDDDIRSEAVSTGIDLAISVVSFAEFVPLIKEVAEILGKINELYSTAQHNKKITKLLRERIAVANSTVCILQGEDLYTAVHFAGLQRLNQVLRKMQNYIEKITDYSALQNFLGAKNIETQFNELCKEYDSSMISLNTSLNLGLMTYFNVNKINEEKEKRILKEDIEDLLKFQSALAESMNEGTKKIDEVVKKVSEMAITMKNLDKKGANQQNIDDIFDEPILPFEAYGEADDKPRTVRLRKYFDLKTKDDFAFKKIIDKNPNYLNQIKNQVTILKKLKDCQNIIRFYGLTFDGSTHYLVAEWAEKGNLREFIKNEQDIETKLKVRIAYDIAKGLNFLNAVKIVHRDIRAENIVITDHDVAKITNFNLSRAFDEATANLSVSNECVRYCAPEILMRKLTREGEKKNANKKYDVKCEVYSFGIILWEIAECRTPYEFNGLDFQEITKKIVGGYREPFTPGTNIPETYQNLVNRAVNPNPDLRPTFAKMLTDLSDLFKNLPLSCSGKIKPPERKMTANDCFLFSIDILDNAIEEQKKTNEGNSKLYEIFDTYANTGVPKAKYWKAYYLYKGWSDLTCSEDEKLKCAAELFKEAADHGNELPDAQLRYGTMVMQGKGVKKNMKEAIEYLHKAADNDHVAAIYNLATYYLSTKDDKELGKYYLTKAASKNNKQAIKYCEALNISY